MFKNSVASVHEEIIEGSSLSHSSIDYDQNEYSIFKVPQFHIQGGEEKPSFG
jgi:hypothetical protein